MATSIRLRRGTDAERLTVIFADGEPVYTTDTHKLFMGDGATLGGIEVGPLTLTWADVGADEAGTAAGAVAAHVAAADPHPTYTTAAEAAAAAPVQSVAGKTGAVTLTAGDVGADAAGTAASAAAGAVSSHEGETDPHPQYTDADEAFEQGFVAALILGA
jgi:hypothetical protein